MTTQPEAPAPSPAEIGTDPEKLPPDRVRLGDQIIRLAPPESPSIAADIAYLCGKAPVRGFAAALAVCWRGPNRPTASLAGCGYDTGRFGGLVYDELAKRGLDREEIGLAGVKAYDILTGSKILPAIEEVEALADFTAGEAGETG